MSRLKELRELKKVTQGNIAQYLGVGRDTVSKWEIGRNGIPSKKLIKLAEYFGVTTDEILGHAPHRSHKARSGSR